MIPLCNYLEHSGGLAHETIVPKLIVQLELLKTCWNEPTDAFEEVEDHFCELLERLGAVLSQEALSESETEKLSSALQSLVWGCIASDDPADTFRYGSARHALSKSIAVNAATGLSLPLLHGHAVQMLHSLEVQLLRPEESTSASQPAAGNSSTAAAGAAGLMATDKMVTPPKPRFTEDDAEAYTSPMLPLPGFAGESDSPFAIAKDKIFHKPTTYFDAEGSSVAPPSSDGDGAVSPLTDPQGRGASPSNGSSDANGAAAEDPASIRMEWPPPQLSGSLVADEVKLLLVTNAVLVTLGPSQSPGVQPDVLHALLLGVAQRLQRGIQPLVNASELSPVAAATPPKRPNIVDDRDDGRDDPSAKVVRAAMDLVTTLMIQVGELHAVTGEDASQPGASSQMVRDADSYLNLVADGIDNCINTAWNLGPGSDTSESLLGLASYMAHRMLMFLETDAFLAESPSEIATRLRKALLATARLVEACWMRRGAEPSAAQTQRGPKPKPKTPEEVWEWDLAAEGLDMDAPALNLPRQAPYRLLRVLSECFCRLVAHRWPAGDGHELLLPLGDYLQFDSSAPSVPEAQAVILTLGRAFHLLPGQRRDQAAKLLLPMITDALTSPNKAVSPVVYGCLVGVAAAIAANDVSNPHGGGWAYNQVLALLVGMYREGESGTGAALTHAGGSPCPDALANALLAVAKGGGAAPRVVREALRHRLLSLFSEFAGRAPPAEEERTGGRQAAASRRPTDLGNLLPVLAAACEGLDAGLVSLPSTSLRDIDAVAGAHRGLADLRKLYRSLWLAAALHDFGGLLEGAGPAGAGNRARTPPNRGGTPGSSRETSWRAALGVVAAHSPVLLEVDAPRAAETRERLGIEIAPRLARAGRRAEAPALTSALVAACAEAGAGDELMAAAVASPSVRVTVGAMGTALAAAAVPGGVLGGAGSPLPTEPAFLGYLLSVAYLERCRAKFAPLPKPGALPPVAPLLAYLRVADPADGQLPTYLALTNAAFGDLEGRLRVADLNRTRASMGGTRGDVDPSTGAAQHRGDGTLPSRGLRTAKSWAERRKSRDERRRHTEGHAGMRRVMSFGTVAGKQSSMKDSSVSALSSRAPSLTPSGSLGPRNRSAPAATNQAVPRGQLSTSTSMCSRKASPSSPTLPTRTVSLAASAVLIDVDSPGPVEDGSEEEPGASALVTGAVEGLAVALIGNLTSVLAAGGAAGRGAVPQLVERLLARLLATFPFLQFSRRCMRALFDALEEQEGDVSLNDLQPLASGGQAAWHWLRTWLQTAARRAPAKAEALLHEMLRQTTKDGPEFTCGLGRAASLFSIAAEERSRNPLSAMCGQGVHAGPAALAAKTHAVGVVGGLFFAAGPGAGVDDVAEMLLSAIAAGQAAPAEAMTLQLVAVLLEGPSAAVAARTLRALAWAPMPVGAPPSPNAARASTFAWHWLCAAAPWLSLDLLGEIVDAWTVTVDSRYGLFSKRAEGAAADGNTEALEAEVLAHHVILGFLTEHYEAVRQSPSTTGRAVRRVYLRLLQASLSPSALDSLCDAALAAGARFRLLKLAAFFTRHELRYSPNTMIRGVIALLAENIADAALRWCARAPGYHGRWSRSEATEEAAALAAFAQNFEELSLPESVRKAHTTPHGGLLRSPEAKQLILLLLKDELQRLQVWCNPLEKASVDSSVFSATPERWAALTRTAWSISRRCALTLKLRFPNNAAVARELVALIAANVNDMELLHEPEGAIILGMNPAAKVAQLEALEYWAPVDALGALQLMAGPLGQQRHVKAYALRSLHACDAEQVAFFLPQLVQSLRNDADKQMIKFLGRFAQESWLLCHKLAWLLESESRPPADAFDPVVKRSGWEPPKDTGLWSICSKFRKELREMLGPDERAFLDAEFAYFEGVTSISGKLYDVDKDGRKAAAQRFLKGLPPPSRRDLYLPTNPHMRVKEAIPASATPMQSAAKVPILVAFKVEEEHATTSPDEPSTSQAVVQAQQEDRVDRVLNSALKRDQTMACIFKVGDDCRQDVLALQVIELLKEAFRGAGLDLYLWPYGVLPTGYECVIIEVVPNTQSRAGLGELYDTGLYEIFQHQFGAPGSERFEAARRAFIVSEAGYAIASYLLQSKDRHNGNVLIDKEGHLIHIDFGFILGISPGGNMGFESAAFKLSHEMTQLLDPSGKQDSVHYKLFQELCVRGYQAARQVAEGIIATVSLMSDSGLPCFGYGKPLANLRTRFHLEMDDAQAAAFIKKEIADAYENWRTGFYDYIQYLQNKIAH